MLDRIKEFIEEQNLLVNNDNVIIGLSGGADSVCLFHVLLSLQQEYQLKLTAVHINHGLREKGAKEDEEFVKELCSSYQIPLRVFCEDVAGMAMIEGISEEEAGRNVRYRAFNEVLEEESGNKIAVAHHMNDSAETILFHLFRGSGMRGLSGIPPRRDNIIRPLLCIGRNDIEEYLNSRRLPYQTDQTNFLENYSRNKIRINMLPYAEKEVNKKALDHIIEAGGMIGEADAYLLKTANLVFQRIVSLNNGKYSIRTEDMQREDIIIQKYVLRILIKELTGDLKDIRGEHVNMLLLLASKEVGKKIDLPYGIQGLKTYDSIEISIKNTMEESELSAYFQDVQIPHKYFIPYLNQVIEFKLIDVSDISYKKVLNKYKENIIIPKNRCTKWFDYDKIKNAVSIRTRRSGDYIQINGEGGSKKLKSYFIDQKIPRDIRDQIPLLADGSHIIWVVGQRMSEAYKVSNETKRILMVKINGGNINER